MNYKSSEINLTLFSYTKISFLTSNISSYIEVFADLPGFLSLSLLFFFVKTLNSSSSKFFSFSFCSITIPRVRHYCSFLEPPNASTTFYQFRPCFFSVSTNLECSSSLHLVKPSFFL